MKIEVRKTYFFVLLGALLLVGGIFFVNAAVPNPGHGVNQVDWSGVIRSPLHLIKGDASSGDAHYDVWIQGSPDGTEGNSRDLALRGQLSTSDGTTIDRLYVNYNSEYTGGTQIGGPVGISRGPSSSYDLIANGKVRGGELCIAGDCRTSWPSGGGGTDTNAETLCPNNQFLDGDGQCRTAVQIVSDGGGGGSSSSISYSDCKTIAYSGLIPSAFSSCQPHATCSGGLSGAGVKIVANDGYIYRGGETAGWAVNSEGASVICKFIIS